MSVAPSGYVLIGNAGCHAKTISARWTLFRHCGLFLMGVVCPLHALSAPDEKKDDNSAENLGKKSPNVVMTCKSAITLSAKYSSLSLIWGGDKTQTHQLPACSCVFQATGSKVISTDWFVECGESTYCPLLFVL